LPACLKYKLLVFLINCHEDPIECPNAMKYSWTLMTEAECPRNVHYNTPVTWLTAWKYVIKLSQREFQVSQTVLMLNNASCELRSKGERGYGPQTIMVTPVLNSLLHFYVDPAQSYTEVSLTVCLPVFTTSESTRRIPTKFSTGSSTLKIITSDSCRLVSAQCNDYFARNLKLHLANFLKSVTATVSRKCTVWERSARTTTHLRNLIHFKCITRAAAYVQNCETFRQKMNFRSSGSSRNFNCLSSFCTSVLFHLRIFFFLLIWNSVSKLLRL
jgi:hypothetical protein